MMPDAQMSLNTPALVAQAVHEARFAEQLVELRAVLVGDLLADVGDARVDVGRRRCRAPSTDNRIDRSSASGSSSA